MKIKPILVATLLILCIMATHGMAKEQDILSDDFITLKEYPLAESPEEFMQLAEESSNVPNINAEATVNDEEVPSYVVKEKVKDVRNIKTGEDGSIYRFTAIARDYPSYQVIDQDDPTYTTRIYIQSYYYGSRQRDGVTFYRISNWKGRYDRLDNTVSYPTKATYSYAYGETYDYDMIGSWVNPAYTDRNLTCVSTWYTLTPSWSTEYISHTAIFGQMGGTYIEISRGGDTWELEVKITAYGLDDQTFL